MSVFEVGGKQILATVPGLHVQQRCRSSQFAKLHDSVFRKMRAASHVIDWGSNSSQGERGVGWARKWSTGPLSAFGLGP